MDSDIFTAHSGGGGIDLGLRLRHLEPIRSSLIWISVVTLTFAIGTYPFVDQIIDYLSRPLEDKGYPLAFYWPAEALVAKIKLSLFTSLFLAMPFAFFQLRKVVIPWLPVRVRPRSALMILGGATFLFYVGAILCLIWVLPVSLEFLIGYGGDQLQPLLSIDRYLTLCAVLTLTFGIMFELPLVFLLLGLAGLVSSTTLAKNRRYAILVIALASAVITPTTDAYTMLLLTLPIIALFEASVWLVWLVERRRENGMD
jgi:sec-independent protein translocase protein TatC